MTNHNQSKNILVDHVIFDMDGLLLDTEKIYTEVTQFIVGRFGKVYDWKTKAKLMGLRQREAAELLVRELDLPITAEEYLKERNQLQDQRFPFSKPMPGALELVQHLKKNQIPIAVATSSNSVAFELKSKNNQHLFKLFDVIVVGDDPAVQRSKPFPDIFLEAAARLAKAKGLSQSPDPSKCLVFEDAPAGVEAALAAGMHCIWVPDPNMDLTSAKPTAILQSLEEFDPSQWGLPPRT